MKNIFFTASVMFALLLGLGACKKKENTNPDGTPDLANFKVTMDGSVYTPLTTTVQNPGGVIIYQIPTSLSNFFTLQISDTLAPGTYPISDALPFRVIHSDDSNNTYYFGTSGSVTVTSHDQATNKIKGTFNCTLTRTSPAGTKTISSGEFNITY